MRNNTKMTLSFNENNTEIFNQKRSEVAIEISCNLLSTVMVMLLVTVPNLWGIVAALPTPTTTTMAAPNAGVQRQTSDDGTGNHWQHKVSRATAFR